MGDVHQLYKELIEREFDSLEEKRRKEYEHLVSDLTEREMVREFIHIEQALELEIRYLRRFVDYALSQFKRLMSSPEAHSDLLEKIYLNSIQSFFSRSLQRMIAIITNVRSPIKEDYAIELLEKVKSEALQEIENIKERKFLFNQGE